MNSCYKLYKNEMKHLSEMVGAFIMQGSEEFNIKVISKEDALRMIRKYHYSNTLPKINKYFLGFSLEAELVGVVTLGLSTGNWYILL